jgi:hypothetical protein
MVLLNDALLDLVKKGIVEAKEAYQKAVDKVQFLAALKAANVPLGDLRPEAGSTPLPNAASGASSAPAPAGASR